MREAIIAATPASACADVTAAHLAAITGLDLRGRTITSLKSGDFAGLTGMLNLKFRSSGLTELPDGIFAGLTALTGLEIGAGNIATLRANVFDDLTAVGTLQFYFNKLTELPAGIFDNLTALRVLNLGDNGLTTLRADVFANNAALEELGIQGNRVTVLPGSIFSTTPRLRQLTAHANQLNALPDGLFSGLSDLTHVWLHNNPGTPFALTVSLVKVGNNGVKATIAEGAPFEIEVPVTPLGGTIEGDATTITIPTGAVESAALAVTRGADPYVAVTVDIGSPLPVPPNSQASDLHENNHNGYALAKAADLPLEIFAETPSTAIDLSVDPAEVAEDAGETTLTVTATLDANSRAEDTTVTLTFGGSDDTATLTDDYTAGTVPALTISGGERTATATITFTPEDDSAQEGSETIAITGTVEVEGLTVNATTLSITDNDEPPEAPGLSAEPGDAQVTLKWTAPANTGTSSITGYDYRVSDETAAPFTWTPDWTAIANSGPGEANAASYTVTMHGGAALANGTQYTFEVRARNAAGNGAEAQVMAKPGEVCGRTKPIADAIVAASPASECGDVTTAHLAGITELVKTGRDIPALKSGDFAGLTAMTKLDLNDNAIRTLPVDIFMGLSQLEVLILDESEFAGGTLPEGVFAGLSGLRELHLHDCGLQTLPRNIFSGLSSLEVLFLSANNFQAISGGLFTDLSTLNKLVILSNELRELPEGFLTGLTNIDIVRMQHNDVDPLAITATLEKDGAHGFRARVHEGAPFDIVLPITISGGTIDGGATALTVAKGTTASTTVEVTRTPSSTDPVTVDIGTLPDVPTAVDQWSNLKHRGYELVKSADLPLEVIEQAESTIIELTVDPATVDEEHGSAVTLTVTATLNAAVRTQATEVTLAVGGDDDTATATMDYTTGSVPTLTIDANAESGTATLTLTPVSDTDGEGDETVTIAGSVDVETITVNAAELTIVDDDATPVPVTLAFTSNPDTAGADDDTYAIGDVVEVTATFSAAITVTGTPRLELDIGGEPRLAECALATDTTKLACAYTVAEGDVDADGIAIGANSITLDGATITLGSDAVTPTHGAEAADSAHKVEAVRPTLTAAATSADGTKVVLTYDETLSSTTAATSAFTVHVSTANATSTPSVSAAAASGTELSLTLGSGVKAGQVVTIDYADPTTANDANAVQDAAGNDAASLSAQAVTNTVAEDATVAGLTMSLSSATLTEGGDPVTVTIETASGATFATDRAVALAWDGEALASNAGLVREPSGRSEVLIAAGESSGTATLVGVERAAYTASKTAALTATSGDTQVGTKDLTYADSGAAPEATIAATPAMPAEGEDITVTVTLSRAVDTDVSVPLTMTDTESVVNGPLPAGGILIAANETTGTVTLSTAADMMTGADADVVFTLTAAEANAPYTLGTPSTVTVTVLDDTSASDEITLSVSPATVDEDAGATTLTVTATMNRAAATTATTVALSVAAGTATETTDYTATTANLTIAANARTGTANLTLTPVDDTSAEADETVTVNGTVTGFTVSGAEVTILDDDEPEITLTFIETVGGTNDNVILVDEDVGQVTVALRATTADATAPTRDFVVRLQQRESARTASIEAGDYKAFERSYTFAAADFSLASGRYVRTVSKDVEIVDDRTVERSENLFLAVDNATIPRYVNAPHELLIQLNDNDTASVGFNTNLHEVEEGETVRITIAVSAPVAFAFEVVFVTDRLTAAPHDQFSADQVQAFNAQAAEFTHRADADDYQRQRQVIEIAEYTREVSAPVQSVEDAVDEENETLWVTLLENAVESALTLDPIFSFVTIIDDDELPGAPTGLTVDSVGTKTVNLSWAEPADTGGNPISGYLVEWAENASGPWSTVEPPEEPDGMEPMDADPTATEITHAGLTPETTYHYRVTAITGTGPSDPSTSVSATTNPLPVMTLSVPIVEGVLQTSVGEKSPALFLITRTGDDSEKLIVNLEWSQDGSAPIAVTDTFDVGEQEDFYPLSTRDNAVDEDDGTITLTLKAGEGYTLGATTSVTITVVDDDERPEAPVLTARADDEEVELTWDKPAAGTSEINRYDYHLRESSATAWSSWTDTGVDISLDALTLTIGSLTNETSYDFEVRAISDAGDGPESNTATATPTTGPTITAIAILSTPSLCDGRAYAYTDTVQIGVTFSEAVTVDTTNGTPYLSLRMADYDASAAYSAPDSSATQLVFTKTIANTDFSGFGGQSFAVDDPADHSSRGLQLNGATIRSSASMANAVLTGMARARESNAHMIGILMIGVTMTSTPASGNTYAIGEQLALTATFNRTYGGLNLQNTTLTLAIGDGTRQAQFHDVALTTMDFTYDIAEGDTDGDGVGVAADAMDLAGGSLGTPQRSHRDFIACNEAIAMLSSDKVDGVRPTLVTTAPDAPATSADGTQILLTFDEELSATTAATGDFAVTVSGMERAVTGVAVDADDNDLVKLTLGSAVGDTDTIVVRYTDPSPDNDANALQDGAGNDVESFPGVAVANNAPAGITVSTISLTSAAGTDQTYAIDDTVTATVTMSEAISVSGTPQLELDVGATPKTAACALATDTTKLACAYTVAKDDEDTDGVSIGANKLSLNGATITKASGDAGGLVLAHGAVTAQSGHKVDGVRPHRHGRKRRRDDAHRQVEREAQHHRAGTGQVHPERRQRHRPDGERGEHHRRHPHAHALERDLGLDEDLHPRLRRAVVEPHRRSRRQRCARHHGASHRGRDRRELERARLERRNGRGDALPQPSLRRQRTTRRWSPTRSGR